jgi:hypothetical protein
MADYWTETIKAYDGLITYPKLEDKYLKRPPFKYIFSVFTECVKVTGLGKGVFSEEDLNKDNYEGNEKRMEFLNKLFKFLYKDSTSK